MRSVCLSLVAFTLVACGARTDDGGPALEDEGALAGEGDVAGDTNDVADENGTPATPEGTGDSSGGSPDTSEGTPPDDPRVNCIVQNPPTDPFEVGDSFTASPVSDSPEVAPEGPTAGSIATECPANSGTGCDASKFISKEAAVCIALLNDFEIGLKPWSLSLLYHDQHERVVWSVTNLLVDDGPAEGYSGELLTLDATDGSFIELLGYAAMP